MERNNPELIAKNECVSALFASVTGRDPYLNDSMREAIDLALAEEGCTEATMEQFLRKALELAQLRGGRVEDFKFCHVNLRGRAYDPLWLRSELLAALKPLTGARNALLVVSELGEAVRLSLPARKVRSGHSEALAAARQYIDEQAARFAIKGCRMNIMYLDPRA
jgi:hypothetical protein